MPIYLDNSSTTQILPEVLEAMQPYFSQNYGNASSLHALGIEAKKALDNSRETIAKTINAEPEEIFFTSGGTEANNIAIIGAANANRQKGNSVITSQIEHSSVLEPARRLELGGLIVTRLGVNKEGFIDLEKLEDAISKKTILVSIQHANHEVGTIQEIGKIGKICREKKVLFHTDACQSFTKVPIDVKKQNIGLMTLNGHKIHGPKGIGALYVRRGVSIQPVIFGGGQENGLRSGTENIPGIVGLAKAAEIGTRDMKKNNKQMATIRNGMLEKLTKVDGKLNGPNGKNMAKRLCNNINVSFAGLEGEVLVNKLSQAGICISTGSACASRSIKPSNVLKALNLPSQEIMGSVRISLSRLTTPSESEEAVSKILSSVKELRNLYYSAKTLD